MSDLWSEHHGPLQMSPDELLNHIKAARLRRRERGTRSKRKSSTPKKKGERKKDPKKAIGDLSVEDLKRLLEMIQDGKR
jgi:hypothetical protein